MFNINILDKYLNDVYDVEGYTTSEVLCKFHEKINEIIDEFNRIDEEFTDLETNTNEKLNYLLNIGLKEEIANKLIEMKNNGELENIINNSIFNEINSFLSANKCFVNLKQQLPNTYTAEIVRDTLQNLVNTLSNLGGGTIIVPSGTYEVARKTNGESKADFCIQWKSNVSLKGSGQDKTIFKVGSNDDNSLYSFIYALKKSNPISNCDFSDFTVDLSTMGNENTPYNHKGKAFYIQGIINSNYERLKLIGTPSTALGIDFCKNVNIDKVKCENCGRMWHLDYTSENGNHLDEGPGGAGIGIGTGYLKDEIVKVTNCECNNCGHYGIFFEHQGLFSTGNEISKNVIITNNVVKNGKFHGIGVRGGNSYIISNNIIYGNEGDGINLNSGETVTEKETLALKNIIINNNICNENRDGISIDGCAKALGIDIKENQCNFNNINGISINYRNVGNTTKTRIVITDNTITKNKNAIYYNNVGNNEDVKIYNNNYYENSTNCGKAQIGMKGGYFTENYVFDDNTTQFIIKIKPKNINNKIAIISNRDKSYKSSGFVKGYTIGFTQENKLYINIVESNGTEGVDYISNEIVNFDTSFYLKIEKRTDNYIFSYSYDKTTYTTFSFNESFNEKLFKSIKNQPNYYIDLFREFTGQYGYSKYAQYTYFYKLYTVNNIGYNHNFEIVSNNHKAILSSNDNYTALRPTGKITINFNEDNETVE